MAPSSIGFLVLDGREEFSEEMVHATPDNEAQHTLANPMHPVKLVPSHGCIHIKATGRDILKTLSLFIPGASFVVHKYRERI